MIICRSFNINIYLFIYLSINVFIWYIAPVQFLCVQVKACLSPDKTSTSEPLARGAFLTLRYHMHFINNRNEEIQAKLSEFNADRMQQSLRVLILGMW